MKELQLLLILRDQWQYPDLLGDLLAIGHYVTAAYGTGDGYLMALRTKPDAIIIDTHTNRINGHSLVTFMYQDARLAHIPVIIATERYSLKECLNRYRSGAEFYFQKNIDASILIAHIRAILDVHVRLMPVRYFRRKNKNNLTNEKNVSLNPRHGSIQ